MTHCSVTLLFWRTFRDIQSRFLYTRYPSSRQTWWVLKHRVLHSVDDRLLKRMIYCRAACVRCVELCDVAMWSWTWSQQSLHLTVCSHWRQFARTSQCACWSPEKTLVRCHQLLFLILILLMLHYMIRVVLLLGNHSDLKYRKVGRLNRNQLL